MAPENITDDQHLEEFPAEILLRIIQFVPVASKFRLLKASEDIENLMRSDKSIWASTTPFGDEQEEQHLARHIEDVIRSLAGFNKGKFEMLEMPRGTRPVDFICRALSEVDIGGFGYPHMPGGYDNYYVLAGTRYLKNTIFLKLPGDIFIPDDDDEEEDDYYDGQALLKKLSRGCGSLKKLKIYKGSINMDCAKKIVEFFKGVQELDISGCIQSRGALLHLLTNLESLDTLDITLSGCRGISDDILVLGGMLLNFNHDPLLVGCHNCKASQDSRWYRTTCSHTEVQVPKMNNLPRY